MDAHTNDPFADAPAQTPWPGPRRSKLLDPGSRITPAGVLDIAQGPGWTPADSDTFDDSFIASGTGRSSESDDEFDNLEPEALRFDHFGGHAGYHGGGQAVTATPCPWGNGITPPPPLAPKKGPSAFPARVQGGSASASRCRERLASAARPPKPRVRPRRTSLGLSPMQDEDESAAAAQGVPITPWVQQRSTGLASENFVESFLERTQGITGTRKRLDDTLDEAVPCMVTPKKMRGTEDLMQQLRLVP